MRGTVAKYGLHINKRAKRAIDGPYNNFGEPFEGDDKHEGHYYLYAFDKPSDEHYRVVLDGMSVSHTEAWLWLRGNPTGNPKVDPPPPTVDEMLEAIAVKLQEDVQRIMLACSEDEGWLRDMYRRSKESRPSISPPWR